MSQHHSSKAQAHLSVPVHWKHARNCSVLPCKHMQLDDAYLSIKCSVLNSYTNGGIAGKGACSHSLPSGACQERQQVLRHAALAAFNPSRGTQTGLVTLAQTPNITVPATMPVLLPELQQLQRAVAVMEGGPGRTLVGSSRSGSWGPLCVCLLRGASRGAAVGSASAATGRELSHKLLGMGMQDAQAC